MTTRITTLAVFGVPGAGRSSGSAQARFPIDLDAPFAIQKDDTGIQFVVLMVDDGGNPIDLQGASLSVHFENPDRTNFSRKAEIYTDGKDGKMAYVVVAGDLAQAGTYQVQGVATAAEFIKHGALDSFEVFENVEVS